MIVVMQPGATETSISAVVERIKELGLDAHLSSGEQRTIIGVVGTTPLPPTLDEMLEAYAEVEQVLRVTKKYKLTGWDFHPQKTIIKVRDFEIGGDEVVVIAGPCSVESEEQTIETARAVKAAGAKALRGGAYKPRTSPYEFRGLGQKGLEILATAREETGLAIITEVMTPADVEQVYQYTDIFQIGARNCQNYYLLEEVGKTGKPVMLKRGMSMLIEEWLLAAEYVLAQSNPNVIFCERGIRTFENQTRNTFDIAAVPVVQKLSHLPIFVDPSHAAGKRPFVAPLVAGRSRRRRRRPDHRGASQPGSRPFGRATVAQFRGVRRPDAALGQRCAGGRANGRVRTARVGLATDHNFCESIHREQRGVQKRSPLYGSPKRLRTLWENRYGLERCDTTLAGTIAKCLGRAGRDVQRDVYRERKGRRPKNRARFCLRCARNPARIPGARCRMRRRSFCDCLRRAWLHGRWDRSLTGDDRSSASERRGRRRRHRASPSAIWRL